VPRQFWEVVSLDFVEGLPLSGTFSVILVVVDKFSKFAHFIPLKHPYSTASVARVFLDNIYKLHGLPVAIISDRDRVFTSKFWQLLFQLAWSDGMSSSVHGDLSQLKRSPGNQTVSTAPPSDLVKF